MFLLQCLISFVIVTQLIIVYSLVSLLSVSQSLANNVNRDVNRLITRFYGSISKSSESSD
jgi:hypothetical protein